MPPAEMLSQEIVVSDLRAALSSCKTPPRIEDVNFYFKNITGYSIPFRKLGHKSLGKFFDKLRDEGEITMEYERGHLVVRATPRGRSAHGTHVIGKQKTTTLKNNFPATTKFSIDTLQNTSDFIPEKYDALALTQNSSSTSLHPKPSLYSQVVAFYGDQSASHNDGGSQSLNSTVFNRAQGNARGPQELEVGNENLVPINLFQDSFNLKLHALPSHQRNMLENLISEIQYQINYFSLDSKMQSNSVKLTCKLCCISLHIAEVEKHIIDQEHLRNLTNCCNSASKVAVTAAIDGQNWDFLDFDESSQCYQCTLCNVNLFDSIASWNKHFQSGNHLSKLKTLKAGMPLNPVDASCLTSGSRQIDLNNDSLTLHSLNNEEQEALEAIKEELKDDINYFKPSHKNVHGSRRLYVICKLCKVTLAPQNVMMHATKKGHLYNLRKNRPFGKIAPAEARFIKQHVSSSGDLERLEKNFPIKYASVKKRDDGAKLSVPLSSLETGANTKSSAATMSVNNRGTKLVKNLEEKLKNSMIDLELSHENGWSKPCFICRICSRSVFSKYGSLHVYSDTHLRNLSQNLSIAIFEASDARNKKIVKDVINRFDSRMCFFLLIYDNESNELYFICKVCTKVLVSGDVKSHIFSFEHSKNVKANPVVLEFNSLNDYNQHMVKELATAIKNSIQDFTLVYQIGSENLRFYCKYCQSIIIPQNVKNHTKRNGHMEALYTNEIKSYNSAEGLNLETKNFECEVRNISTAPPEIVCNRVSINGDVFDIWPSEEILINKSLTTINLDLFRDAKKTIIESFKYDFNLYLKYFDFLLSVSSNQCFFKCKLCEVHLKPTQVMNHIQAAYHLRNFNLSMYFDNFLSLERVTQNILRSLSWAIGEELKNFSLLIDRSTKKPLLKCKFCEIILYSDFVVTHLQDAEHQKFSDEYDSEQCTPINFESKYGVDGEPTIHELVENSNSVSLSNEIPSSFASINSPGSTPILNFDSVRSSDERISREILVETTSTSAKKSYVFNRGTLPQTTIEICDTESEKTCPPPNLTTLVKNPLESERDAPRKGVLKTFRDRIGTKIIIFILMIMVLIIVILVYFEKS